MFKRVTKRQRKIEREQELGLDDDMKQMLGLEDTDSDESESSSSDKSGNESDNDDTNSGNESEVRETLLKRKHTEPVETRSEDEDEDISDDGSDMSAVDDVTPPMGIMAALTTPIYAVQGASETQDLQKCIICPGRLFKNAHMAKEHVKSSAHIRRMQRYTSTVTKLSASPEGLATDDPRDILLLFSTPAPASAPGNDDGPSKRSLRKAAQKIKNAERRKAKKEKAIRAKEKSAKQTLSASMTASLAVNDDDTTKEQNSAMDKEKGNGTMPKKGRMKKERGTISGAASMDVANGRTQEKTKLTGSSKSTNSGSAEDSRPKKRKKLDTKADLNHSENALLIKAVATNTLVSTQVLPPLNRQDTSQYFADDEKRVSTATQLEDSKKANVAGASKQGSKGQASHKTTKSFRGGGGGRVTK